MLNSSKPIKFAHLQKLANQSSLNDAHVLEITKTCIVALVKARNPLIFCCREKLENWKITKDGKINFSKLLLIDFGRHQS